MRTEWPLVENGEIEDMLEMDNSIRLLELGTTMAPLKVINQWFTCCRIIKIVSQIHIYGCTRTHLVDNQSFESKRMFICVLNKFSFQYNKQNGCQIWMNVRYEYHYAYI